MCNNTLCRRGPFFSFLYELFNSELRARGLDVETGIFGADMNVSLTNDGPFTVILE